MDRDVERVIKNIKSIKIQGARHVVINALKILEKEINRKGKFDKSVVELAKTLSELRPTQATLHNAMEIAIKSKNAKTITKLIEYFENVDKKIAEKWWMVVKDGDVVATHCHSSEEMALLKEAKKRGVDFEVIVTETRPKMQGIKSAKELSNAGIKVRYVVDSAVGYYIKDITKFIFGCDAIREEGIYNKIGTYMMAVLAKENNKPVYFVGDILKVDLRKKAFVEMRDPREVINPEMFENNVEVLNPAFDCTPWKYVDRVLTDDGMIADWQTAKEKIIKKL